MSEDIITCIVDCARVGKLHSIAQLVKETSWRDDWAKEFGPSLLLITHEYYPALCLRQPLPPMVPSPIYKSQHHVNRHRKGVQLARNSAITVCNDLHIDSLIEQRYSSGGNSKCPKKINARSLQLDLSDRVANENTIPVNTALPQQHLQSTLMPTAQHCAFVSSHLPNLNLPPLPITNHPNPQYPYQYHPQMGYYPPPFYYPAYYQHAPTPQSPPH
jgi:hypothetical protein